MASFEMKKAAERNKILEAQLERVKCEFEAKKQEFEQKLENTTKSKYILCLTYLKRIGSETQVALMNQRISQLEKELAEKDNKWKSATGEKEAELVKKLTDYKERVFL